MSTYLLFQENKKPKSFMYIFLKNNFTVLIYTEYIFRSYIRMLFKKATMQV